MRICIVFSVVLLFYLQSAAQHFTGNTMRVDYLLTGDASHSSVVLWQVKEEPGWGGPLNNLLDPFHSGNYRYSVTDISSGVVLYRKGFSTLFEEFQGTPEAASQQGVYPMTATFPYPVDSVLFTIDRRNPASGQFELLFSHSIDPAEPRILRESVNVYPVYDIVVQGDPADHLDILFLAEGYRVEEMQKFRDDARRMADYFISVAPFSEYADRISFRAVESPSVESGVDHPAKALYCNTAFNSSFNTFGSDRYLTTSDTWSMRDAAANAPHDQIIILNNTTKYGGGGFYNHYCQSTVDNDLSEIVAIHEFGHSFGGLADEYVGGVNYDGMYSPEVEPWEPNITTLVDFPSKWAAMVSDTVPVPTPREPAFRDVTGVFEGGGYMAEGVYSPAMTCRMKENSARGFCPVCQQALQLKILYYCDQRIDF